MSEIERLVATLKRQLKARGMTYQDLSGSLGISEPTVKRMFASGRFTVDRLVEIARALGLTLVELVEESAAHAGRLTTLDERQERELVADTKTLLVAVCVLNRWTTAEITRAYDLTETEVVGRLARLDRLRLIDLLPGDRIRLNVAHDFDWLPNGPIRAYFLRQGMGDFLGHAFVGADDILAFSHGMLTDAAIAKMRSELRRLRQRLTELHEESLDAPLAKRRGVGLLLAMREWELAAFTNLRRRAVPRTP
ncbi:MAG: helix-turn-helix domain-containing protein [Betaproteobacteria bacterium]|nr:helix-turn-helix domain-containing protein [Betaproteobacteria bacterium]